MAINMRDAPTPFKDAQAQGYIGECKKKWLTAYDERVCPICSAIDGETADMDAPFSIGKLLPPAHPLCRCAVAYELTAAGVNAIIDIETEVYLQNQLPYFYNGEKNFIPNGAIITNKTIIAGNNSKNTLREANRLSGLYGGEKGKWSKCVGKVVSAKYDFDVHWYELDGKQYETKLKHRRERK